MSDLEKVIDNFLSVGAYELRFSFVKGEVTVTDVEDMFTPAVGIYDGTTYNFN